MRLIDADALREHYLTTTDCALVCIDEAPTIDAVEQKHGHWIWDDNEEVWKCSNCGLGDDFLISKYCKDCGAKMDEEVME